MPKGELGVVVASVSFTGTRVSSFSSLVFFWAGSFDGELTTFGLGSWLVSLLGLATSACIAGMIFLVLAGLIGWFAVQANIAMSSPAPNAITPMRIEAVAAKAWFAAIRLSRWNPFPAAISSSFALADLPFEIRRNLAPTPYRGFGIKPVKPIRTPIRG
ncbi:MAG: hypothetical protein RLZZ612_1965 [Pseudomonadota bacterium]